MLSSVRSGFTLVEMLVVIAIIGIMSSLFFAPYHVYSRQSRWYDSLNQLSQSPIMARTFAANGYFLSGSATNSSVALSIIGGGTGVDILALSGSADTSNLSSLLASGTLISRIDLDKYVEITGIIGGMAPTEGVLIFTPPDGIAAAYTLNAAGWTVEASKSLTLKLDAPRLTKSGTLTLR